MLKPLHKHLLNDFQRDFPLCSRPYQDIAHRLGVSEEDVLLALTELNNNNFISRIGLIIPPNQLGVSTLVAMAIPEHDLESVAVKISAYSEVNHNYEREHTFNLWFVAVANNTEHLQAVLEHIEQDTGYKTMSVPLLDDFFIDLGFQLDLQNA